MSVFSDKIYEVVRNIPVGETHNYKQVAELAGYPNSYRSVGSLMKKNYNPDIPCHRVIKSDGKMGDYNRGGAKAKKHTPTLMTRKLLVTFRWQR